MGPDITAFFDEASNTISYVVRDPNGSACAIIDSVLDFDFASGRTDRQSADKLIKFVQENKLDVQWLLESHVHADHLSAAPYIQEKVGGKIGIGSRITDVQETFGKIFNEGTEFQRDGSQFDKLFVEGDTFHIGQLRGDVLHTPGHTPACLTYVVEDAAFVGDTLFMPDGGTARADFPGGDARTLYQSIQKILALPDQTRMFVCHDYAPNGREFLWETSVAAQRAANIHVGNNVAEDSFVDMRQTRDASLAMPRLIMPSIQVNMRAGHMPEAEENGATYLKVPIQGLRK